jgi:monovalent cation:H+ antiporter-2, CPA2 family
MHHDDLLVNLSASLVAALIFGLLTERLRLSPIVGYLLAGILLGPHTPGVRGDAETALQFAEIGVVLLMFGVGLHFNLKDLWQVRKVALPGAAVQITVATLLGTLASQVAGVSITYGVIIGIAISVASTVVLVRVLTDNDVLHTTQGHIAVGWLIVEDIFTVLVLVALPAVASILAQNGNGDQSVAGALGMATLRIGILALIVLGGGKRVVPWLLGHVARTRSRELFTLAVLALALSIAVGSAYFFGVSMALGAFLAGMVVGQTEVSHQAAADALPMRDAFAVLFFVAVGMLFDPAIVVKMPLELLSVVMIVMIGKSLAAFFIVVALRRPVATALTISASLAQIGEFSFILAALAFSLGLLPAEGQSLIVAGSLISIALNPVAFAASNRLARWIGRRPRLLAFFEGPANDGEARPSAVAADLHGHVILIGYGRVGSTIGQALAQQDIPYAVIEQNRELVESVRAKGIRIVYGDATRPNVLRNADIEHARLLVLATPDPYHARAIVEAARAINPALDIIARSHTESERIYLERHGVSLALIGEHELAFGLAHHALMRLGLSDDQADGAVGAVRHWSRHAATLP